MEWKEVIKKRKSVRSFTNQRVSKELLTKILTDAIQTPSWGNSQPWRVYVATGQSLINIKKEYLEQSQQKIRGNSDLEIISSKEWDPISSENIDQSVKGTNEFVGVNNLQMVLDSQDYLFHSGTIVYFTMPKNLSEWSIYDIGAFSQTLQLSAAANGLRSIPAYATVKYPTILRKELQIPDSEKIIMGVALGYADESIINKFQTGRMEISRIAKIFD